MPGEPIARLLDAADAAREAFGADPGAGAAAALVEAWTAVTAADASAEYVFELGNAWHDRFDLTGDPADLGGAVRHFTDAVRRADPPDAAYLNGLGFALRLSYLTHDDPTDLDRSVELLSAAVRDGGTDERPTYLDNLRRSLGLAVFLIEDDLAGRDQGRLDGFVDGARLAARFTATGTEEAAQCLVWLGAGLDHRWDRRGDAGDLAGADAAFTAVEGYDADAFASELAVHHYYRYRAFGRPDDLDRAVGHGRRAVALGRDDPLLLANLGRALWRRHEVRAEPGELGEAIDLLRAAIGGGLTAYGPDLANAHLVRFEGYGDVADLDEAVAVLTEAADELPIGSPNGQGARNDLANALRTRFVNGHDAADLSQARAVLTEVVEAASPGSAARYLYLDNLANLEVDEFTMTGDPAWLDRALSHYDEALRGLPESVERRRVLTNRAGVHWHRWTAVGDPSDLRRATTDFDAVVARTPPAEAGYVMRLNNLAVALAAGTARDRVRELFARATAPGGGDPLWALRAARGWGRWAAAHVDWAEAATAYGRAQTAMAELVAIQGTRRHREQWLREIGGLPAEAAYASWKSGRAWDALGRLDRGRGLLLSQALADRVRR